jgi:hypothetical protein
MRFEAIMVCLKFEFLFLNICGNGNEIPVSAKGREVYVVSVRPLETKLCLMDLIYLLFYSLYFLYILFFFPCVFLPVFVTVFIPIVTFVFHYVFRYTFLLLLNFTMYSGTPSCCY